MTDAEIITHLGGPKKLADRLGFPQERGVQRVSNWCTRGIPAAVKVQWPEIFMRRDMPEPATSAQGNA
jgi:hypothetical protein